MSVSSASTKEDALLQVKAELAEALHQKAVIAARDEYYVFVKLLAPLMLDGNDYRDGKKHGRGIHTWPNADRFEGDWRNGKMQGRGIYNFASGAR